jgi:protein-disulfide isomerase
VKKALIIFVSASFLLVSASAWAASTKQEIQELSAQVEEMQKDLAEIKNLLKEIKSAPAPRAAAAAPAFKEQVISIGDSPYKGKADATVTLVEFSDYQCPFCARNYREVMPTLEKEYIDTGKLKFVMRENPIPSLHRNANNASMAALCAGDQDKYWEMHNLLFDNQRELDVDNLKAFAGTIGLDTGVFNECLDSKKYEERLAADIASGAKLGVRGTPGFVLGLTDPKDPDKATMSVFIKGARPIGDFKREIDALLKSVE